MHICVDLFIHIYLRLFLTCIGLLWQGESFKFLVQQKYLGYVCILVVRCGTCQSSTWHIASTRDMCKRQIAKRECMCVCLRSLLRQIAKREDISNTKIAKRGGTSLKQTCKKHSEDAPVCMYKYARRKTGATRMHVETLVHPRLELPPRRPCQGNGKDTSCYKEW